MSDLTTRYLGLTLKSPLVASASPLCESAENIGKLEDQGIAAVVLPSLFEEQLVLKPARRRRSRTWIGQLSRVAQLLSRSAHL